MKFSLTLGPTPVGAILPFHLSMGLLSGAFTKLWKTTISFVMSVCLPVCPSSWNESVTRGRISVKFDIWAFFENVSRKMKFYLNRTRLTGTLHEDLSTFMVPRWIILGIRNLWDKSCTENQNTFFVQKLFSESRVVLITWKNIVMRDRSQTTIRPMRFSYWIPKATDTHLEYVILIAFPGRQLLRENAWMLRLYVSPALFLMPDGAQTPKTQ